MKLRRLRDCERALDVCGGVPYGIGPKKQWKIPGRQVQLLLLAMDVPEPQPGPAPALLQMGQAAVPGRRHHFVHHLRFLAVTASGAAN